MYKCLDCGHVFDDGEQEVWEESRGEFWGAPCSEVVDGCPRCHGDYEEAKKCSICGGVFVDDDLFGGVCEECIEKHGKDIGMVLRVSSHQQEEIRLNCLFTNFFKKNEIEKILFEELTKKHLNGEIDFKKFIEDDIEWFGEYLAKEVEKDEKGKD